MRTRALAALLAIALGLPGAAAAQLFAERLTQANLEARRVGGIDAVAGLDDWALGNGTLCAAISDAAHEAGTSERGGALVDLGHCGRNDDQWSVAQPMLKLGRDGAAGVDEIRAEIADGEARVITRVTRDGIQLERTYALSAEPADLLRIRSRVERVGDGPRFWALGEVILHPSASLSLFAASRRYPEATRGFQHPSQDASSLSAAAQAFAPLDFHAFVGGDALEPGIAYAVELVEATLERASGEREALPFFAQSSESHTLLGVAVRPFWLGSGASFGWLQLGQFGLMDLARGDRVIVERAVRVGERSDVASAADEARSGMRRVRGHVDDPQARVHVEDAAARPFSFARPDASGEFSFAAPPGRYRVRALAPGGRAAMQPLEIASDAAGDVDTGWLRLGPASRVRLPRGATMRLVFKGVDGTPDPRFRDPLLLLRFAEYEPPPSALSNDVSLAGVASDPAELAIAPGHYLVYATRGPEYDVKQVRIAVTRGAEVVLRIDPPQRVLDTPGWIAADLHVHSGPSNDSALPVDERLRSFAAQGAEILVATEHDRVYDPAPRVRALGLEGLLRSVVGSEITSTAYSPAAPHTFGHANAFPLSPDPRAYRGGAIRANGRRLRDAIADVRALGADRFFQLNHPRSETGTADDDAFFEHLSLGAGGLDPAQPPGAERNAPLFEAGASGLRDADFDALELLNGPSMRAYRALRADWLWLWLNGEPRTATANSDSHGLDQPVGLPRTYVRVADDDLTRFDEAAFVRALRAGRALGTSGPFVEVALGDARPGDSFRGARGLLRVRVQAAPWVPVSTLRVWNGAEVAAERPIGAGQTAELPLSFARDSFIWVEVFGEPDATFAALAAGFVPLAFTNPVRVDADDDGRCTPPGLPTPVPRALALPLSLGPDDPLPSIRD